MVYILSMKLETTKMVRFRLFDWLEQRHQSKENQKFSRKGPKPFKIKWIGEKKNCREAIKMSGNTPYGNNETSIMVFFCCLFALPQQGGGNRDYDNK
jgi:hypothetical protein